MLSRKVWILALKNGRHFVLGSEPVPEHRFLQDVNGRVHDGL